ncbi:response regulator transcription factor [Rhodoferax sp. GW822-FHT02A01]|uniref:response regulator transcription factor n=1 Tax=Rhodoferax sp. GW822-FHT02A01 TaxID=3141537 RepID=UPI00315DFDCB
MKHDVLIADDHAIIRDGLRKILADTDDLVVQGEAANGNALLEQVRARDWSLLVLDISMPGRNGLELVKMVKNLRPKLPILIFSMHPEEQYAVRAIRAGASGYLSKEGDSELLLPAMRRVVAGGMFISPNVAELLASDMAPQSQSLPHTLLTDREFDVFSRIVRGMGLTAIAAELSLSVKTVSTHKTHILAKMNLSTQIDLVRYAIDHHLVD